MQVSITAAGFEVKRVQSLESQRQLNKALQTLRTVAEKLTGGLLAPLLTHLVRAETLSNDERRELRSLIDELDRQNKSRK